MINVFGGELQRLFERYDTSLLVRWIASRWTHQRRLRYLKHNLIATLLIIRVISERIFEGKS